MQWHLKTGQYQMNRISVVPIYTYKEQKAMQKLLLSYYKVDGPTGNKPGNQGENVLGRVIE